MRPIPQSFYHLERFDSENTGTAIAQVGRVISPVPSSRKIENVRWHRWLGQPSSPVGSHVAVEGSHKSLKYAVSPGVSEICRLKQEPPPLPPMGAFMPSESNQTSINKSRAVNKLPSSSDSSEILQRYEELVARLRRLERFDTPLPRDQASEPAAQKHTEEQTSNGTESRGEEMAPLTGSSAQEENSAPLTIENQEPASQDSAAFSDAKTLNVEYMPDELLSSQPPLAEQQACAASDGTDPDETWKAFLFGDEQSDELCKAVLEEAKQDALRNLQPSDPHSSDRGAESAGSNAATVGTLHVGHGHETSESTEAPSCAEPSTSTQVSHAPSSTAAESRPVADFSDDFTLAPSIEVNAGTSSWSGVESAIDSSESNGPASVEEADSSTSESHAAAPSTTTSMAVAPARSEAVPSEMATTGDQFRFAQPKLFVGSRSSISQPNRVAVSGVGISLAKRKRGRPKKRANDGRADIRALPNYSSDPIEEFEDEGRGRKEGRVPKSLFPALEMS
jgi:hypothetical protein